MTDGGLIKWGIAFWILMFVFGWVWALTWGPTANAGVTYMSLFTMLCLALVGGLFFSAGTDEQSKDNKDDGMAS